ncbi:MAG: cation-translocating P-type ATPase, partial [Pedobacter sp.]
MEKTDWKVEGMTCSNCALSVSKYLQKKGMEDVNVNPITGAVSFINHQQQDTNPLKEGIQHLGYKVLSEEEKHDHSGHGHDHDHSVAAGFLGNNKKRFLFTLPFTLVLMLHILHGWLPLHWLINPWLQLALCLPVFLVGMRYFGKSAVNSLRNGIPNMDVLIALGSLAAFVYSLTGAILQLGEGYLFFETTASIITLVFMGNYLEEASVNSTQKAIRSLAKSQKVMANMIAYDDQHQENIFPVDNSALKTGDLILIKNGEQVPADCKILWGECLVNEAIITGESLPVSKQKKDLLIGGSILENGTVKAQVTAAGKDTVLSGILKMVENAQSEKPPLQKLADKI